MKENFSVFIGMIGMAVLIIIAWEIMKNSFRAPSAPVPPPPPVIHTSPYVEVGDVVLFRYSDDPQTLKQVMISGDRSDPANGCIIKDSPLGNQLLGLTKNQTITCYVPGGDRQVDIIAVKKAVENIKGPIGAINHNG